MGLISGWDGGGFDIAVGKVRVRSELTGTTSEYDENGRQDKLAAVSRRTRIEFDGIVDGNHVPEAFKGLPIALITVGIMAMAFLGFSGIV